MGTYAKLVLILIILQQGHTTPIPYSFNQTPVPIEEYLTPLTERPSPFRDYAESPVEKNTKK